MTRRSAMRHWSQVMVLLGAMMIVAAPAAAQDTDAQVAETLFKQGKTMFDGGDYAGACAKFKASQDLDPAVGTLLFLGDCNEKQGKAASAYAAFQGAKELAAERGDKREKIATVRAKALEPLVSRLEINVLSEVEGLVVRRDGVEVPADAWGAPQPVDAGEYTIEAIAPGYEPFSKKVEVEDGGTTKSVDIPALVKRGSEEGPPPPAPLPTPTKAEEEEDDPFGGSLLIGGIVMSAAGLGAVIAGGVIGSQAQAAYDESLELCRTETICSAAGLEKRDDASSKAGISTGLFVGGGIAAAAGLTALVVVLMGAEDAVEPASETALRWTPQLGPRGAGLTVGGAW